MRAGTTQTRVTQFDDLYAQHEEALLRYALRRVGPAHAGDVVAETFLVAWRRPDEIPPAAPLIWLYAVARNHIRNHLRSQAKWHPTTQDADRMHIEDRGIDDQIEATAARLDMQCALSNLDFDDAEVLRLVAWEGLTATEGALVLGCSAATFRVRLHRARKRLRLQLKAGDQ
jgi:RNA polymerase sigma-70 factor, ECF subfamily